MTVISIAKFQPHPGKAKLLLSNMQENVKMFSEMGITARISRDMFGPDAGALSFSTFSSSFTESMSNIEKVFASEFWAKVQMRMDDNPSGDLILPLTLIRTLAGEMKSTHRYTMWRWYHIKRDKMPMAMDLFPEIERMCNAVDLNPIMLAPVTGEPMSSAVIGYGATSLKASGKAMDEMGMSDEFRSLVEKAAAFGELFRAWMSVPVD